MAVKRRDFLKLAGVAAGTFALTGGCRCGGEFAKASEDKPNIILVVSDDQGYGDFGCFGNEIVQTPNLDELYKKSSRFENFYVCPVCAPTRASLMTGRYNYRTGVWDTWKARMNMHNEEVTVAEVLRDNGYRTGMFGKWHLGYNYPTRPVDQGFEQAVTFYGTDSRFDPLLDVNGEKVEFDGYLTDIFFDKAIDFIRENKNRSFFAYVPSFLPHYFPGKQVPEEETDYYRKFDDLCELDKETYAMVTRFDKNLGRLLEAVKQEELEEDTLIIFLSDNGADIELPQRKNGCENKRYNYNLRGGKGTVYEGGIKVPCFFYQKGKTSPGLAIKQLAAHIDIMPTILEACGIKNSDSKLDGVSLLPLLNGGKYTHADRSLFFQFQRAAVPDKWEKCAVRDRHFKLVNGEELYNITEDPGETNDLSSLYPKRVKHMRKRFSRWYDQTSSTRGFEGQRIIIGSDAQPCIRFKYWNQIFGKGFKVDISKPGGYSVRMTEVQNELLDKETTAVVSFDGRVISEKQVTGGKVIEFDNLSLPAGKGFLRVWFRGLKDRTMPYGEKDPGYRFIFVEKKG